MMTPDGKEVGQHIGLAFYTLGQRKGIGLGGSRTGNGDAWYVARKDMASNTLYVVQGHEHPWLLTPTLDAADLSWVAGEGPAAGTTLSAKSRYRQSDAPCTVTASTGDALQLTFAQAQWAVTPGQSAVLYDGDICLGGGIIQ